MENTKKADIIVYIYIVLAFAFSIGVRMIWIYQFSDTDMFYWNNQIMINTNDGYYYAEGARDILAGHHQPNDLSPVNTPTSLFTAFMVQILPFSFETIILFMPAFLGSLLVVPLVLMGKNIKNAELGLIAALLASIAWSYYNRTMVGYYDTDMLNIVFPTFVLWSLVLAIQEKTYRYLILSAIFIIAYGWWYPQSYSLNVAFFGLIALYTIFFERKNIYLYQLLTIIILSILYIPIFAKLAIIFIVFGLYRLELPLKIILLFLLFSILIFIFTGGFDPIIAQVKGYIVRDAVSGNANSDMNLHFFSVLQTVREAGKIPFELFANRISGNMVTFFVSLAGYVWLCIRHRFMLLGFPMLGLGFLAYNGGLRFTVYAVPVLALGIAYLFVKISEFIENRIFRYIFLAVVTLAILYPNVIHVSNYKVPTVFNKEEVKVIEYLKKHASREDYVVSWWDYGYPLRYYGDVKTLVDGGKHSGESNFAPSFILTHPQEDAAKMARLDVEYTEKSFKEINITQPNIVRMIKDYGFSNANDFLKSIKEDMKLPDKTRDIYIYLPYRMMNIYPTIAKFSYIDLMNGKMTKQPFSYRAKQVKDNGKIIFLGDGISFNKTNGMVTVGKNKFPLKSFYIINHDKSGKIDVAKRTMYPNGYFSILFAKTYGAVYLVDNETLNSTYVQLFFLENYNKDLFELVKSNPFTKLYKLKK